MGKVTEDWSVSADLCCPLSLDQDRLDCELALMKWRTTAELQDNLILCYLRMPPGGYPIELNTRVRLWRQRLIDELVTRKPIHWRPWLGSRLSRLPASPTIVDTEVMPESPAK